MADAALAAAASGEVGDAIVPPPPAARKEGEDNEEKDNEEEEEDGDESSSESDERESEESEEESEEEEEQSESDESEEDTQEKLLGELAQAVKTATDDVDPDLLIAKLKELKMRGAPTPFGRIGAPRSLCPCCLALLFLLAGVVGCADSCDLRIAVLAQTDSAVRSCMHVVTNAGQACSPSRLQNTSKQRHSCLCSGSANWRSAWHVPCCQWVVEQWRKKSMASAGQRWRCLRCDCSWCWY
jgi:hypothetical protein